MPGINVRIASRGDYPEITRLWQQMMRYHEGRDPRFTTVPDAPKACERYLRSRASSRDSTILVAAGEGGIVGYSLLTILENPAVFQLRRYGFVAEMCVDEAFRRQGIGRRLWEHAVGWFRRKGIRVVQLNVASVNEEGRRFWQAVGCREYLQVLWYDIGGSDGDEF